MFIPDIPEGAASFSVAEQATIPLSDHEESEAKRPKVQHDNDLVRMSFWDDTDSDAEEAESENTFQALATSGTFASTLFFKLSPRPDINANDPLEVLPKRINKRIRTKMSIEEVEAGGKARNDRLFEQHLDTVYFDMNPSEVNAMPQILQVAVIAEVPQLSAEEWNLGGRSIHHSHKLGFSKGVSDRWSCGAWCVAIPTSLVTPCRAPTRAGSDSDTRMSK